MRAAIFNPYLDTLGGGERYTLSFARVLLDLGFNVDIEWKDEEILKNATERFGINLKDIGVVDDIKRGDGYDLCFWVSDGSIPALKARKNILHFQVPFHDVNGTSLLNKMKFFRISSVVCNSQFTKKVIDAEFGLDSKVIYPPVDVHGMKPKRKENIILSVGRFSKLLQSKHQDILIKAFQKIYDTGNNDWKLILAGGAEVGDDRFTEELKEMSQGYPIQIIKSPKLMELKDLYGKSKIFWSASGFNENEILNPEKVEHFGITLVEAMSSGNGVLAFNAGGHKEIIEQGNNGYLWTDTEELIRLTEELIKDRQRLRKMSLAAVHSASEYGYEKFRESVSSIL
jgi:glycosyltransferase involved in cell wall biosynthesis